MKEILNRFKVNMYHIKSYVLKQIDHPKIVFTYHRGDDLKNHVVLLKYFWVLQTYFLSFTVYNFEAKMCLKCQLTSELRKLV